MLYFGLQPVPAAGISDVMLCGFIYFLAAQGKKYATIKAYLAGPRMLQLLAIGTWTKIADRPIAAASLRAARRMLGDAPNQKLAITAELLTRIHDVMDFTNNHNVVIYTAFLVALWGFLRKSNIGVDRESDFNNRHALRRCDVSFDASGNAWLRITKTKTIQFNQRVLCIPLPIVGSSPKICPATWLRRMLALIPGVPAEDQLFSLPGETGHRRFQLRTHAKLVRVLKTHLVRINVDPTLYAGHSFRRGGATLALTAGVPVEYIKLQGDWRSNAYQLYAGVAPSVMLAAVRRMSQSISGISALA